MTNAVQTKESAGGRFPFFFLPFVLASLLGCENAPQDGRVVARVNDAALTMEMIREQTDTSHTLTEDEIRQYVNRWVTNELLFQEADQRGYDETETIQRKMVQARKQLSIAEMLEKEVYALAEQSIGAGEIEAYFQRRRDEYMLRENLVRLSLVIFTTNDAATRFRASALGETGWNESLARFRADGSGSVVTSSDSLFFTQPALYPPELWKVAAVLGMNEVSFPVNTSVGYVVMRSLGQYKKGGLAPIEYAGIDIRHRLAMERRQQRYQEFLQKIRTKHTVQYTYLTPDTTAIGE